MPSNPRGGVGNGGGCVWSQASLDSLEFSVCLFLVCLLFCYYKWASLVAQKLKRLPAMQETRVWSLVWEDPLEKEMATHSNALAWRIPWMVEPGRLQSMGLQRVGHDWATSLSLFTFMHWRRKWQPTPVFLPGESHGWWSLVGYSPRGRKESDTTQRIQPLSP